MNASADQIATVIELACLTKDRDGAEQRALLDLALAADLHRGRIGVVTLPNPVPPCLVELVRESCVTEGRRVDLLAAQQRKYDGLLKKWAET